ncbi:DUF2188 domain-containing protein [Microbacterium oxydans]|uniref:DUF2188 domain-containing protein n=1 Tax=Microbacterium sp. B19(2022) TaxID=2914045 RepID=UPI00142F6C6D|nr:DUF2188 domain-containing protein [Microbacterium sp. B19(2022)]NJI58795.1 DUF2188 domain-containing protein [Microbacterium sp. B19(2022)]
MESTPEGVSDGVKRVVTRAKNGQWVNEVEGAPDLSRSYSSRDEAIEEADALAQAHGVTHVVQDSEPTGTITDGGGPDDDVAVVGEKPLTGAGTDTTDENGFPLENPSG